jgi:uncharacterized protein YecT (DUF1311 family)
MLRYSLLPLACAILIGTPAPSNAADAPLNCDTAMSTPELNACAGRALDTADAALNDAYKKALAFIKGTSNEKPHDPASWERALRASQKAWLAYRDADCGGLVPMSWGGGTGTTSAVLYCKTVKTETRTTELTAIYTSD